MLLLKKLDFGGVILNFEILGYKHKKFTLMRRYESEKFCSFSVSKQGKIF